MFFSFPNACVCSIAMAPKAKTPSAAASAKVKAIAAQRLVQLVPLAAAAAPDTPGPNTEWNVKMEGILTDLLATGGQFDGLATMAPFGIDLGGKSGGLQG